MTKTRQLTPKQEKFAQCIAQGMSYCDAYRNCYDTKTAATSTLYKMSYELTKNPLITGRVKELRALMEESIVYSAKESFDELQRLKKVEEEKGGKGSMTAVIKAEELRGKLAGFYKETDGKGVTVNIANIQNSPLLNRIKELRPEKPKTPNN